MRKRTKAAEKMRRYRERRRAATGPDIGARIAEVRALLRSDAPADLVRDYARVGLALDEELVRTPRRSRAIQELINAKSRLAEQLQITPQARKASGEAEHMVPMSAVVVSLRNVLRFRRTRWELMREEIQLFGAKEDPAGRTRAMYVEEIGRLRAEAPDVFEAGELAIDPGALYDKIAATGPRLPGEVQHEADPA